jgi:hypothetical protein
LFVSCIIIHKDGVAIFQLSNITWKRKCIQLKYNSQSTTRCKVHVHLCIQVLVVNMFIMSFYSFLNHLHQASRKNNFCEIVWYIKQMFDNNFMDVWSIKHIKVVIKDTSGSCELNCELVVTWSFVHLKANKLQLVLLCQVESLLDRCVLIGSSCHKVHFFVTNFIHVLLVSWKWINELGIECANLCLYLITW